MRIEGWEHRLVDLIEEAQTREFVYGTWDCALFACAAIAALTDKDVAGAFRGQYADAAGCDRLLAAQGGLEALATGIANGHDFAPIPIRSAQRGDVVLATIAGRDTLGVCLGRTAAFAVAPRGLAQVPILHAALRRAWRIG